MSLKKQTKSDAKSSSKNKLEVIYSIVETDPEDSARRLDSIYDVLFEDVSKNYKNNSIIVHGK